MRKMKIGILTGISLLAWCFSLPAQEKVAPAGMGVVYSLDQFGPVDGASVNQTYQKATEVILANGGGVLVLPEKTAAGWVPRNNSQKSWRRPAPPAPCT